MPPSPGHAPIGAIASALVALALLWLTTANADQHPGHEHHHGTAAYGSSGKEGDVSRTIEITASDNMRHEPSSIIVKPGETIEFVVKNTGKMRHEFMLGDAKEQHEHAEMMRAHPDMVHDDPNAVTVEPGESKTLLWRFGKPGEVEGACHIPGHYEAGMVTHIQVTK
jgi:uncharacterized cupredoxin-like copper-binding protein